MVEPQIFPDSLASPLKLIVHETCPICHAKVMETVENGRDIQVCWSGVDLPCRYKGRVVGKVGKVGR